MDKVKINTTIFDIVLYSTLTGFLIAMLLLMLHWGFIYMVIIDIIAIITGVILSYNSIRELKNKINV